MYFTWQTPLWPFPPPSWPLQLPRGSYAIWVLGRRADSRAVASEVFHLPPEQIQHRQWQYKFTYTALTTCLNSVLEGTHLGMFLLHIHSGLTLSVKTAKGSKLVSILMGFLPQPEQTTNSFLLWEMPARSFSHCPPRQGSAPHLSRKQPLGPAVAAAKSAPPVPPVPFFYSKQQHQFRSFTTSWVGLLLSLFSSCSS